MNPTSLKWFFCLALFFLAANLMGQEKRGIRFSGITPEDGLAGSHVCGITMDERGFLWIGTNFGVQRYDGLEFRTWSQVPGDTTSISGNLVYTLLGDQRGKIWVGTSSGLNLFDSRTEKFKQFHHIPTDSTSLGDDRVEYVCKTSSGTIWVGTLFGGLNQFLPETETFKRYRPKPENSYLNSVAFICEDKLNPDLLWISGGGNSHWFFPKTGKFKPLVSKDFPEFNGAVFFGIFQEGDSLVWLPTFGGGLFKFDRRDSSWARFKYAIGPSEVVGGNNMESISQKSTDEFWVSSVDSGFGVFHKKTGQFSWFKHDPADPYSILPQHPTRNQFRDPSGTLWISMHQGISKTDPRLSQFREHKLGYSNSKYPYDFQVTRVIEDTFRRKIFAATRNGSGIYQIDLDKQKYEYFPNHIHLKGDAENNFDDLILTQSGRIIGLNQGKLLEFFPSEGQYKPFPDEQFWNNLKDFQLESIMEDSYGNIWGGSSGKKICRISAQNQEITYYNTDSLDSKGDGRVGQLREAPDGTIWFAMQEGVYGLNPQTRKISGYRFDPKSAHGISSKFIHGLEIDAQGNIWIGTQFGGVNRITPHAPGGEDILILDSRSGLSHNSVWALAKDRNGIIWACTQRGIASINPQTLKLRNFDHSDGLDPFLNDPSLSAGHSGVMYIGILNGLRYFHLDSLQENNWVPPLVLTSFKVNGALFMPGGLAIDYLDTIMLEPDENFISIEFSGINYQDPEGNKYLVKMEGVDDNWKNNGNKRQVDYPNLPPGWYRFWVKVANEDGIWNENPRSIAILIRPHWYQTWWFYLALTAITLGTLFALFRLRMAGVRKEEQLKSQFNQRLAEVEMAALRAQMNPHFLFNCINSINRLILSSKPREASVYLADFADLVRQVLKNSESNLISLAEELKALDLYINLEKLRFEDSFEYSCQTDSDIQLDFIRVPPLILQPFVENAIWHGLLHKTGNRRLQLRIVSAGGMLICEIEDNGIGRAKAGEIKQKSSSHHVSRGIGISSDRLWNMKKISDLEASVEIEDLYGENGNPAGTLVKIKLPM
ncbi:MAG: histidine kinase [Bacteroidia bacterium]|nr:histidine kinase [Bacteroidia bacterium]